MDKEKFGQAVRFLRIENNISQKELAQKLCVTPAAVSKWEHGQNYPDITMLHSIAEIFHVSCDALLQPDMILNADHSIMVSQANVKKHTHHHQWIMIIAILILISTASLVATYSIWVKTISSEFQIISNRTKETVLGEKIYEMSVYSQDIPEAEQIKKYCMKLKNTYNEGLLGSFSTLKIFFYTDPIVAESFEEKKAFLVTEIYFEE